jgi:hypothetical protein
MNRLLTLEQINYICKHPGEWHGKTREEAIAFAQDAQTMNWLQEQCQEPRPCEGVCGKTEEDRGRGGPNDYWCYLLGTEEECPQWSRWQGRQEGYAARQAELDGLSKEPKPCPCRIYDHQVCDKENDADLANVCIDMARWYYRQEGKRLGRQEVIDWVIEMAPGMGDG